MNDYFYDFGWEYADNKETAYRTGMTNKNYRVFKYYKDGRMESVTDVMPKEEAIEKLKQIHLLDPVGQMDWVDDWHEAECERRAQRNDYLTAKGRI